jgi:hypothetical protein
VSDVKKLVDQVLGRQAPGVVDRRLAAAVVGDDADEAVADRAALVTDGEDGDALGVDPVVVEPKPRLPTGQPAVHRRVHGRCPHTDNASQFKYVAGRTRSRE